MTDGPALRLVVTRGGDPTPKQAAVLVAALAAVRPSVPPANDVPGWLRAAIHEGVGGPAVSSAQATPRI